MNKQIILDPFSVVGSTGTTISDMNKFLGTVLEKITLNLAGTALTKAMLTSIQLIANGKVIFDTTGATLDAANAYNAKAGVTADATILKIDFMDRQMRTPNGYQAGAIDLSAKSGITSLRLQISIAGATAPLIFGIGDVNPPSADPAEQGIRWIMLRKHRAFVPIAAAGQYALPLPHFDPAGGGSVYRRVYVYSANMTALKTVREGVAEHEITKAQNDSSQRDNGKYPQANLFVFDPVQTGLMQGSTFDTRLSAGIRSAQFLGTFSALENIVIETEELLPFAAY